MILDFISSWGLFYNTYLVGWLIAVLLSLTGVFVVARDQIFIGAAVSQASTLGIALGMWVSAFISPDSFPWIHSEGFLYLMAVAFSIMAAIITSRSTEGKKESHEAVTGWVFLVSASVAILIVSHSPHGLDEIYRLLSSSIIGATATDVWVFTFLAGLTALILKFTHRHILLFAMDRAMASSVGMKVNRWEMFTSAWLGLVVGLSIRSSGMLYTFGLLVLPALIAKNLCKEVRPMFLVSPVIAVGIAITGFIFANHYDYPPAQMTVALLCFFLSLTWLLRKLRSMKLKKG